MIGHIIFLDQGQLNYTDALNFAIKPSVYAFCTIYHESYTIIVLIIEPASNINQYMEKKCYMVVLLYGYYKQGHSTRGWCYN